MRVCLRTSVELLQKTKKTHNERERVRVRHLKSAAASQDNTKITQQTYLLIAVRMFGCIVRSFATLNDSIVAIDVH